MKKLTLTTILILFSITCYGMDVSYLNKIDSDKVTAMDIDDSGFIYTVTTAHSNIVVYDIIWKYSQCHLFKRRKWSWYCCFRKT